MSDPATEAGRVLFAKSTQSSTFELLIAAEQLLVVIIAIEQEARTLARTEVIAEAVAAVEALTWPAPRVVRLDSVLAALSRLGERE